MLGRVRGPFAIFSVLAAGCLVAGCFDESSTLTSVDLPTLLTVDPRFFRGGLLCGAPGLESYVVTLTDVTTSRHIDLAPSGLAGCTQIVSFSSKGAAPAVEPGHYYIARIDGYDRADLHQLPAPSAVVDPAEMPVAPRWSTTCGEATPESSVAGDASLPRIDGAAAGNPLRLPTLVQTNLEAFLLGCLPLTPVANDGGDPDARRDAVTDADAGTEGGEADAQADSAASTDSGASMDASADDADPDGEGADGG